jgi:hypothetical protein
MAGNGIPKPRWWALYVLCGLLVGLIGLVQAEVPLAPARRVLDVVATLTVFGMIALWVHLNRVALDLAGAPPAVAVDLAPAPDVRNYEFERSRRRASGTT